LCAPRKMQRLHPVDRLHRVQFSRTAPRIGLRPDPGHPPCIISKCGSRSGPIQDATMEAIAPNSENTFEGYLRADFSRFLTDKYLFSIILHTP